MTNRSGWKRVVLGVLLLVALSIAGLAQAQTELQVTITPPEAVAAGAQWRIVGEAGWRGSGTTADISTSTASSQFVEFSPVSGWIQPGTPPGTPVEVLIVFGQLNTPSPGDCVYTHAPAPTAVQVFIQPPEAIAAGAQWRIVGEAGWRASGTTVDISTSTATSQFVEFSPVTGWIQPGTPPGTPVEVLIVFGQVNTPSPEDCLYTLAPVVTALQVFIQPPQAVAAGAQWRIVGEAGWRASGTTVDISTSTATSQFVEFSPVSGWIQPGTPPGTPAEVLIVFGQLNTPSPGDCVYTLAPIATAVQVFIQPPAAVAAGAQWRIVGEPSYHASGFVDSAVTTASSQFVEFGPATGWIAPGTLEVLMLLHQVNTTTATYTPVTSAGLRVHIDPTSATLAGAQWRYVSATTTTLFVNSDVSINGLAAEDGHIEFRSITGWVTPANQNVTLLTGQIVQKTGTYTPAPPVVTGLQVFIAPSEANAAGAMWRLQGETTYNSASGATRLNLAAGPVVVQFGPVAGWMAPADQNVTIVTGQIAQATGTYTAVVGAAGDYKISYKGCSIALNTTTPGAATGLIVTNANAATIKIQKLSKVPPKHADVPNKTLYMLDSPGLAFLDSETGTIKSLSGTGAFIPAVTANVTDSIKWGVSAVVPDIPKPYTSISLPTAPNDAARAALPALKVTLTGVSLENFAMTSEAAAIKLSAKKVKGATIPADVMAGAQILAGNGLSLGVTGGNIYADLIQSQGTIGSLSAKAGNIGPDPATPTSTLLGDILTSPTLAVLAHPSTPVVVAVGGGIGTVGATTVNGVYVAGANLVTGLLRPTCSGTVGAWRTVNASGDAFVNAPAKQQPSGIAVHTTAP